MLAVKTLVQLRDGRKIIGIMRSFDQFANVVLEEAVERIIVGKLYCDVPLGLYVIRGENVVLLGQIVRASAAPVEAAHESRVPAVSSSRSLTRARVPRLALLRMRPRRPTRRPSC